MENISIIFFLKNFFQLEKFFIFNPGLIILFYYINLMIYNIVNIIYNMIRKIFDMTIKYNN